MGAREEMVSVQKKRVLVAMSGGVDSSVAAALLVEEGHEVVGATMKTFCYREQPGPSRACCGLDGILDARRVADQLGIPHYVFDVEEEFTRDVVDDFVTEYARGRTPNPCVRCNSHTKFRDLLRRGGALGCAGIATGHYVRVRPEDGEARILRGRDAEKDQSYFLWGLPPSLLPHLHFPVGELTKGEVRARARSLGLATADKPESQDICFVPDGDYRSFLERRLPELHPSLRPGNIVRTDGSVVGEHAGYAAFTVGQRKGLGGGFRRPHFVLEIHPETREVVVGPREELDRTEIWVGDVSWLTRDPPREGDEIDVQVRHRARGVPARVAEVGEHVLLRLREPQRAVTPGQSAAIFRGERLLGGGRIARAPVPAGVAGTDGGSRADGSMAVDSTGSPGRPQ